MAIGEIIRFQPSIIYLKEDKVLRLEYPKAAPDTIDGYSPLI